MPMPSFCIPKFPKFGDATPVEEIAGACNQVLDEPDTVSQLESWVIAALKQGDRKTRRAALVRAYYARLEAARQAAMDSPAAANLHQSLQEALAHNQAKYGMPYNARKELLDALSAAWRLERDMEAAPSATAKPESGHGRRLSDARKRAKAERDRQLRSKMRGAGKGGQRVA